MNNCKILVFLILSFSILTCLSCKSQAGLFNEPIPKGKEIKDPYLEQLFAPEFPYESIKVIDTEEDKRYVIVKAKQSIIREMEREYENKTLFNRKVTIYRAGSWSDPHRLDTKYL